MLFNFLKYLQPIHYFQLYRGDGTSSFPLISDLPQNILEKLEKDTRYTDPFAMEFDLSWQALQKGYIGNTKTYTSFEKLPIVDEYRFIRKYFHVAWVTYVLLIRLLSLKNPVTEISAYYRSRTIKRSLYLETPLSYELWDGFKSDLVAKNPMVSVVIPTLNRYEYLKDVLEDLEKQDYTNFEVIVVDQSHPFQKDFYTQFSGNNIVIHQEAPALWLARNSAIEMSKGEYLLLFDDDSRVEANWISSHLKCLDFFKADISSGVSISAVGAEVPKNYSFFRISDQLDTGNVLLKKDVFRKIGLFDRQFEGQRMGDGEFGLRSHLNGFVNISNPYAGRLHLKVASGGLRQMGSWDAFRPKQLFAPRPIPSVLYYFRKYYGNQRAILALLKTVPPSLIPYRFKKNRKFLLLGLLISLFLFPWVVVQVAISWRKANKKLAKGALIRELN